MQVLADEANDALRKVLVGGTNDVTVSNRVNLVDPHSSLRPIARFVVEMQRIVCDCAIPPKIKKLWSKGIAMHVYGISAYYA